MFALLIFVVLVGFGLWNAFGVFGALFSAGFWLVAGLIAFVMGPKYPTKPYRNP